MRLIKIIVADIAAIKKERLEVKRLQGWHSPAYEAITELLNELERELNHVRDFKDTSKHSPSFRDKGSKE